MPELGARRRSAGRGPPAPGCGRRTSARGSRPAVGFASPVGTRGSSSKERYTTSTSTPVSSHRPPEPLRAHVAPRAGHVAPDVHVHRSVPTPPRAPTLPESVGTVAAMASTSRFRYSKWDGTQVGFDLDADAVLEEITDDLLYHGDLHAALRRMMQQGFRDRNGDQVMGMRDLMERLRRRRRDQLERYDLGGVYEEIAESLREVLDMERAGPRRAGPGGARERRRRAARRSPTRSSRSATSSSTCSRPTWPGWCRSSRSTSSPPARRGRSSTS